MALRFTVFGAVSAYDGERELPLGPPKQRAVLALMLLEAGRVVSVSRFLEELWGDEPPESAVPTLRAYVSRLRRILHDVADSASDSPIRRRSPGYLLDVPAETVDCHRFSRLVAAAQAQLSDDPAQAGRSAEQALGLMTGSPLADVVDQLGDRGAAEAGRLAELMLAAEEIRLTALLQAGDAAGAVAGAVAQEGQHPYHESFVAVQMLGLYRLGRQSDALAAYERVRRRLSDELGVDPGSALRRLHAQMLKQDPELDHAPMQPRSSSTTELPSVAADTGARTGVPLLGRNDELRALDAAVAHCLEGRGGVCLVSGEPGIGKSRLFQEVADHARRLGASVVWGRALETAGGAPFWPWVQVMQAMPDVSTGGEVGVLLGTIPAPAGLPPGAARMRSYDAVTAALTERSRTSAVVLLLEDLHWADEASLELLAVLAERVTAERLLVVCSYRPHAAGPGDPLGALLARLARHPALLRVELSGLSQEASTDLLTATAGRPASREVAALCTERSDGNPFFLIELARALEQASDAAGMESLPASIRDFLRHRIAELTPATQTMLRAAAVVGRDCDLSLLAAVVSLDATLLDDALTESVHAGLVIEHVHPRPRIRFRHALVRETLYQELRPTARARLHAAVGAQLQATQPGEHDAIAHHLTEGAPVMGADRAVLALLDAARLASARLAFEHALAQLERAAALLPDVADTADKDALELKVQSRRGSLLAAQLGYAAPAAAEALARAYELTRSAEPDADALAALYGMAAARCVAGDFASTEQLGHEFVKRGRDRGEDTEVGRRWEMLGRWSLGTVAWHRAAFDEAIEELTEAFRLAGGEDQELLSAFVQDPETSIGSFLAAALTCAGQLDEGTTLIQRVLDSAEAAGAPFTVTFARWFDALILALQGDAAAARMSAAASQELATEHGYEFWVLMAGLVESWGAVSVATTRAERVAALSRLRKLQAAYEQSGAGMLRPLFWWFLADAERSSGHADEALIATRTGLSESHGTGERLAVDRLHATYAALTAPTP